MPKLNLCLPLCMEPYMGGQVVSGILSKFSVLAPYQFFNFCLCQYQAEHRTEFDTVYCYIPKDSFVIILDADLHKIKLKQFCKHETSFLLRNAFLFLIYRNRDLFELQPQTIKPFQRARFRKKTFIYCNNKFFKMTHFTQHFGWIEFLGQNFHSNDDSQKRFNLIIHNYFFLHTKVSTRNLLKHYPWK